MTTASVHLTSVAAVGLRGNTMGNSQAAEILCFVDVLCGYCYLADVHREKLEATFGNGIQISYHFLSVFGDVRRRIEKSGKSGCAYAAMVRDIMKRYDAVDLCPTLFEENIPTSSVPAHLYLRAVKVLEEEGILKVGDGPSFFEQLLCNIQAAFFREGKDVSQRAVLDSLAAQFGIPCEQISRVIDDGRAYAELANDTALARQHNVSVTPTLVLGDQTGLLADNIG